MRLIDPDPVSGHDFAHVSCFVALAVLATALPGCARGGDDEVPGAPRVVAVRPADGATGVDPEVVVEVDFDERLRRAAVGEFTVRLVDEDGRRVPVEVSFLSRARRIRVDPVLPLAPWVWHAVEVGGPLTDAAGARLRGGLDGEGPRAFAARFRTRSAPPLVEAIDPRDGAVDVDAALAQVTVTFSRGVVAATVTEAAFYLAGVPGTVTFAAATRTATLTLRAPLGEGRLYTIVLTPAIRGLDGSFVSDHDAAGEATGAPLRVAFRTAAQAPEVTGTTPADGAADVDAGLAAVLVALSEPVDPASVGPASVRLVEEAGGSHVLVALTVADGIAVAPIGRLGEGVAHRLEIDPAVTDASGIALQERFIAAFTTARTPPRVASAQPAAGARGLSAALVREVRVVFSEPIDPSGVAGPALRLGARGEVTPGALRHEGAALVFVPDATLLSNTHYEVTVDARLRDGAGIALAGARTLAFDTGRSPDTNPPSAPGAPRLTAAGPRALAVTWTAAADDGRGGAAPGALLGHYRIHRAVRPLAATTLTCETAPATPACAAAPRPGEPTCCARRDRTEAFLPGVPVPGPTLAAPLGLPLYYAVEAVDLGGNRTLGSWTRAVAGPVWTRTVTLDDGDPAPVEALAAAGGLLVAGRPGVGAESGEIQIFTIVADDVTAATPVAVAGGGGPAGRFGASLAVAAAGGVRFVVAGEPGAPGGGRVHVFRRTGDGRVLPHQVLVAEAPDAELGAALAAGDVDGDGADDLVIGAPGEGTARVLRGGGAGFDLATAVVLADPDPAASARGRFGAAVAVAGRRVVVGAPGADAVAAVTGGVSFFTAPGLTRRVIEGPAGTGLGAAVALTARGTAVAGAPGEGPAGALHAEDGRTVEGPADARLGAFLAAGSGLVLAPVAGATRPDDPEAGATGFVVALGDGDDGPHHLGGPPVGRALAAHGALIVVADPAAPALHLLR